MNPPEDPLGARPDLAVAAALKLPAGTDSPRRARTFVSDFCTASGLPAELCETASLLVSELVTNAIVHGRTSCTVDVHRPADTLRIAVRDDSPALPAIGDMPELDGTSGRGLFLVSVLAPRWGIEVGDGGKSIWFELQVDDSA